MKGPLIVSGKDNRLFRPTIPPPFSGDSNMRLVVLCTLIFLVSLWVIRFFSPAVSRRFRKKPFISSDHGTREPPRLPSHVMSVTFCFLCRNFAVSFQQACASPPDFNVGVGTGVLPLLCVAYGRPSAHEYGRPWGLLSLDNISRVGFAKIKRRKFAIADRGPLPPHFNVALGSAQGCFR